MIELMLVVGVISVMAVLTGPAMSSLRGAGSVNQAVFDLSSAYELGRSYAMANHTYVRVGLAKVNPGQGGEFTTPVTAVCLIYSGTGDNGADVGNDEKWPMVVRPLIVKNILPYNFDATQPNTSSDVSPLTDGAYPNFARKVASLGGTLEFSSTVEFNPLGEARVSPDTPARYIKLGWDQPLGGDRQNRNPFLLRISGINGAVNIFRKEVL